MARQNGSEWVPLGEAAQQMRLNREQALRRIQKGAIVGAFIDGRWYVRRSEIARVLKEREQARAELGAGAL